MVVNWENLGKNALDPQTILAAIDSKIDAHMTNPNAHIGVGQSLETHRDSSIADHLAGSVVNDKLQKNARVYTAIVDPNSPSDYATLALAVAYCITLGGGNIYLVKGNHTLLSTVTIPRTINLFGADPESTFINCERTIGRYLILTDDPLLIQYQQNFNNLTIANYGGGCINIPTADQGSQTEVSFNNCKFQDGGNYITAVDCTLILNDCFISVSPIRAVACSGVIRLSRCTFNSFDVVPPTQVFGGNLVGPTALSLFADDCDFSSLGTTVVEWFNTPNLVTGHIRNSNIAMLNPVNMSGNYMYIQNNSISLSAAAFFGFANSNTIFSNNIVTGGTGSKVRILAGSLHMIVTNNRVSSTITDLGTRTIISGNDVPWLYELMPPADTAVNLQQIQTVQHVPTATKTLTAFVALIGESRTLMLRTDNTTAKTITFGAGFRANGNLSMGTTANRIFTIRYVSNGVAMVETSRTVGIA